MRQSAPSAQLAAAPKVPRLWPNSTIVCLATGPSLCQEDVDAVYQSRSNGVRAIAINDAYKLAPWADVLYACDEKWWGWHHGVPSFAGLKYACLSARLSYRPTKYPDVKVLQSTGRYGLDLSPQCVRDGHNSGYQAINVAIHLGATRIALLGYDCSQGNKHFFGRHPDGSGPIASLCLLAFQTLPPELKRLGVTVINCSRQTAIPSEVFPRLPLSEALCPTS